MYLIKVIEEGDEPILKSIETEVHAKLVALSLVEVFVKRNMGYKTGQRPTRVLLLENHVVLMDVKIQ